MNSAGLQVAGSLLGAGAMSRSGVNAFAPKTAFVPSHQGAARHLTSAIMPSTQANNRGLNLASSTSGGLTMGAGAMRGPMSLRASASDDGVEPAGRDYLTWSQTRFAGEMQAKHAGADFGVSRDYEVVDQGHAQKPTDCLVVPLEDGALSAEVVKGLDAQLAGHLTALEASGDLPKAPGASMQLPLGNSGPFSRLVLVNTPKVQGDAATTSEDNKLAQHIATALKQAGQTNAKESRVLLSALASRPSIAPSLIQKIVTNTEHALYGFDQYKGKKLPESALNHVDFELSSAQQKGAMDARGAQAAVSEGVAVAKGMTHAKDLANMPSNDCTPTYLAQEAENMALNDERFSTKILDEDEMKSLGMNSLLSVSNGSVQPAKLIIMKYEGADPDQKPIALVGKGITFDSGGISIKPSGGMEDMKFDMGGAASVFGVMTALKEHRPNINVVGVVAAAENMPSGTATNPGDVVETMSGKTVEIINTDAEGRLVLCDAMTYTQQNYDPKEVIDVATLTGAIVVALGDQASGVFSNDDKLAQSLVSAGERSGDRAWQLPVWPEYETQLKSHTADLKNVGGRAAGSITAARFLSTFADRPWAHLDVAGTASKSSGATGRPVPLLYQHLMDDKDAMEKTNKA